MNKKSIREIAQHYGYEAQSRQCIEEMAELTQAINKMWRKCFLSGLTTLEDVLAEETETMKFSDEKEYQNVAEEIADVQIMLWQLEYLLNTDVEPIIEQKINRQLQRIKDSGK